MLFYYEITPLSKKKKKKKKIILKKKKKKKNIILSKQILKLSCDPNVSLEDQ